MASTTPTVSVVVPTYNRRETLDRAVESVLGQTYEDFELVIVDDGSTDGTRELVQSYEDDRIRYLRNEGTSGANAARNRGIRASDGRYVSFLDSDDAYAADNLAEKVSTLESLPDSFAGVFTPHRTLDDGRLRSQSRPSIEVVEFEDIVRENVIGGFSCVAVRRDVFDRVGLLDEELKAAQDYDFYLRTLRHYRMRLVDSTEAIRHIQSDSIGLSLERKVSAHSRILEKHGEYLTDARKARQLFFLGMLYGRAGEPDRARQSFEAALRSDATLLRAYPSVLAAAVAGPVLPTLLSGAYSMHRARNRALRRIDSLLGASPAADDA